MEEKLDLHLHQVPHHPHLHLALNKKNAKEKEKKNIVNKSLSKLIRPNLKGLQI